VTRFFAFLAAVAVAALGLPALSAPTPAGAAPDTNKVLVVGDSVAYGVGCLLGDDGNNPNAGPNDCPAQPGFTTKNKFLGACTISLGAVLGYDGNLYPSGCQHWQDQWKALIDKPGTPYELVILNTGGWEVVDRWTKNFPAGSARNWSPPPNYQWGDPNTFAKAANVYARKLRKAIQILSSRGAIVLVMNSPYVAPTEPEPVGVFYEPYGPGQPANWSAPSTGIAFRSSENKIEQFDAMVKLVVQEFPKSQARSFDFLSPFSLPGGDGDGLEYASQLSVNPGPTSPGHPCQFLELLTCISPRQGDGLHLTPAGLNQVLAPFLVPRVRSILKV
jgi:hypothetical protein